MKTQRTRRGVAVLVILLGMLGAGMVSGSRPAEAATTTKTVRYGPFTMAANGTINNKLMLAVAKPCVLCNVTSMQAGLVYADGSNANVNTGPMLHHMVLSSAFRSDPTCSGNLLGLIGQRFFASGNERTTVSFPSGFGYNIGLLDSWNMIVDLMNMSSSSKTVYLTMTYTYTTSSLTKVNPVWLDIDQCGDSEYTIPVGVSDTHWTWNVNVAGKIVAIGGHVHDDGVRIEATNDTTGQSICNSVGRYGETPDYIDQMGMAHLSSMSKCVANPVANVTSGQKVRIHSIYDSMTTQTDVMGIMIAYIA